MNKLVAERQQEARSDEGKAKPKRELEDKVRATKIILNEFKAFLVEYINKIGTKDGGAEEGSVPIGFLIQSLWKKFINEDKEGWINLEELEWEVNEEDVATLLERGIIKSKPDNPTFIQLDDFTMRY